MPGLYIGVGDGIYARIDGKLRLIANELTLVPGRKDLTFSGFAWRLGAAPDISGETVVFTGSPPGGIYVSPASTGIPTLSKWAVAATTILILAAAAGLLRLVRARR